MIRGGGSFSLAPALASGDKAVIRKLASRPPEHGENELPGNSPEGPRGLREIPA